MEHVPDPARFAAKLLDVGRVVIASVPYLWPDNAFGHLHHGITHEQLVSWFGRADYSEVGIINEVRRDCGGSCRRVYVVYQPRVKRDDRVWDPSYVTARMKEQHAAEQQGERRARRTARRKLVE
jgi:hypothetical protein